MSEQRILVEFEDFKADHKSLSALDLSEELAYQSDKVINSAMVTLKSLADKVEKTMKTMIEKPDKVELGFGLKLDAEAGALIAKAGASASLNLKLTWLNTD